MSRFKSLTEQAVRWTLISTLLLLATPMFGRPTTAKAEATEGVWQVFCDANHYAKDDPIVMPGQPGAFHMHSFYGNTSTNANSTTDSLMAASSSCGREMQNTDHSAYWVPSLYKQQSDGSLKHVTSSGQTVFVYYERPGGSAGPRIQPFPNGLRMIAGNHMATSTQPDSVLYWACGGGGGGPHYGKIPTCNEPGQPIHATVNFPNCWDGVHLDSADHKSHMAYGNAQGTCPSSHPVSLPRVVYNLDYEGIAGGPSYSLASGNPYSMHADFFAAWDVRVQNALVSECLNTPRDCLDITRDGNRLYKPDYDPGPIPDIDLTKYSSTPQTTGQEPTGTSSGSMGMAGHNDMGTSPQVHTDAVDSEETNVLASADTSELPNTGPSNLAPFMVLVVLSGYVAYLSSPRVSQVAVELARNVRRRW